MLIQKYDAIAFSSGRSGVGKPTPHGEAVTDEV